MTSVGDSTEKGNAVLVRHTHHIQTAKKNDQLIHSSSHWGTKRSRGQTEGRRGVEEGVAYFCFAGLVDFVQGAGLLFMPRAAKPPAGDPEAEVL